MDIDRYEKYAKFQEQMLNEMIQDRILREQELLYNKERIVQLEADLVDKENCIWKEKYIGSFSNLPCFTEPEIWSLAARNEELFIREDICWLELLRDDLEQSLLKVMKGAEEVKITRKYLEQILPRLYMVITRLRYRISGDIVKSDDPVYETLLAEGKLSKEEKDKLRQKIKDGCIRWLGDLRQEILDIKVHNSYNKNKD